MGIGRRFNIFGHRGGVPIRRGNGFVSIVPDCTSQKTFRRDFVPGCSELAQAASPQHAAWAPTFYQELKESGKS